MRAHTSNLSTGFRARMGGAQKPGGRAFITHVFQTQMLTPTKLTISIQTVITDMPLSNSDVSHLSSSPSLTLSVDSEKSFSLPSPKGDDLLIEHPQFKSKFPSHLNQLSTRRMDTLTPIHPPYFSTSTPSSPSNNPPNKQDTLPESHPPHFPMR